MGNLTRLVLRGVRGSIPTPGEATCRHGGNTTCLEVELGPNHHLLIDCGSGLTRAACASSGRGTHYEVLLTHFHGDHLVGLPFFQPIYEAANCFTFHGVGWDGLGIRGVLEQSIRPPWFPISFGETPAAKQFVELGPEPLSFSGLTVRHERGKHPQGVTLFRLEGRRRSVVLATDHEAGEPESDARLRELARGADVLIHDAQYTPEEYDKLYRGWGHSSWRHAAANATAAGVGQLVLFHHDPSRTDAALDRIVHDVAGEFQEVVAAREGMIFEL